MKKTLPFILGLVLLSGCAHQYVIKLTNGMQLSSPSKPRLHGANYYVKDAYGKEHPIPQSRVTEIEPTSMAQAEKTTFNYPTPKRHWWQFWK